ncbi:hypothetical protein Pint_19627 [Pistacia integerrima]|uniref:Uncharacterized protein n=1 Tax=Pistacia integerrima TaxID=434235 RepID=A0ACC0XEW1_9ROSI|nr:hypothetical protein Pint_19627 [Pistacia integerrima]
MLANIERASCQQKHKKMERRSCTCGCGSSYSNWASTPKVQSTPVQVNIPKKENVKPEVISKNEAAQAVAFIPAVEETPKTEVKKEEPVKVIVGK